MMEMIKILMDIGGLNGNDEIVRDIGGYWWF